MVPDMHVGYAAITPPMLKVALPGIDQEASKSEISIRGSGKPHAKYLLHLFLCFPHADLHGRFCSPEIKNLKTTFLGVLFWELSDSLLRVIGGQEETLDGVE